MLVCVCFGERLVCIPDAGVSCQRCMTLYSLGASKYIIQQQGDVREPAENTIYVLHILMSDWPPSSLE